MHQIGDVAGREVSQPLIEIVDADFVKELERVTGGGLLVARERGKQLFGCIAHVEKAERAIGGAHVPLHGVPEQMDEDEQRILGVEVVVDEDRRAVEVAGERVRHVGDHDGKTVPPFDPRFGEAVRGPVPIGGIHARAT
ncbi:MAG: hypothetical protein ABI647_25270 [Gemmatimonadota bacterium]